MVAVAPPVTRGKTRDKISNFCFPQGRASGQIRNLDFCSSMFMLEFCQVTERFCSITKKSQRDYPCRLMCLRCNQTITAINCMLPDSNIHVSIWWYCLQTRCLKYWVSAVPLCTHLMRPELRKSLTLALSLQRPNLFFYALNGLWNKPIFDARKPPGHQPTWSLGLQVQICRMHQQLRGEAASNVSPISVAVVPGHPHKK